MRTARSLQLVSSLALGFLMPGCIVAAVAVGVAAGIVIHETVISEDTIESELKLSREPAFEAAKEELKAVSSEPISIKPDIYEVEAKYGGCNITASVRVAESDRCYLRVKARELGFAKLETARYILHRIHDRIAKK